jgi:hypothetical protein
VRVAQNVTCLHAATGLRPAKAHVRRSSRCGDAGGVVGSGSLTGLYGTDAIEPIVSAYWIGQSGDQSESGGGPFVDLFSTNVSCNGRPR